MLKKYFKTLNKETTPSIGEGDPVSEGEEVEYTGASEDEEPKTKRRKYAQKYKPNWEESFNWLQQRNGLAFCSICTRRLVNNKTLLRRHEEGNLHKKRTEEAKTKRGIIQCFENIEGSKKHQKMKTEITLIMHCIQNNISFNQLEKLSKLISVIFKQKYLDDSVKCDRKKATAFIKTILGPYALTEIAADIKNCKFSIIVDETTDLTCKKCLVVIVRYFDKTLNSIKDKFFNLTELKNSNSEEIFCTILERLKENNIPIKNIIGFGSDNASVMAGDLNGVKTKLRQINPKLFFWGCSCHSLNLCVFHATKMIPQEIIEGIKLIHSHFGHSPKRMSDFEQFQVEFCVEMHKILLYCPTRWLSLESCVSRIIEQWQPLFHYFTLFCFENPNNSNAAKILELLNDKKNLIYLKFLYENLHLVNISNKTFQSEETKIHVLFETVERLLVTIMKNFIQPSFLAFDTDLLNKELYLKKESMFFGLAFENFVLEDCLNKEDISEMRKNMLNFCLELCKQIKKRFSTEYNKLFLLSFLNPKKIASGEVASIARLFYEFSHSEVKLDILNEQWRGLIGENDLIEKCQNDNIVKFWINLKKIKNGLNEEIYADLANYMIDLCTLPHSSASAERKFSNLKLIKDSKRNLLQTETIHNILLSKELIVEENKIVEPSLQLLNYSARFVFKDGTFV